MHVVQLSAEDDLDGWREAARALALAEVTPGEVDWIVGAAQSLFGEVAPLPPPTRPPFSVPKPFLDMATLVICHREPERLALLYTLLTRIRDNRAAMEDRADPLVQRLDRMAKEVRRDAHKMHAVRALSRGGRGRAHTDGRLVRARASHRPARGGLLRAPLRLDALVDPDARRCRSTGTARRSRRAPAPLAPTRRTAIRSRRPGRLITPRSSTPPG
jgi:DNA polymerase